MTNRTFGAEWALLGLFVLSGFAGLIYQAVWAHYLGLTLGHAAYAQTLVLAIFMGGMALGAWWVSRYLSSWRHLVLAYGIVEAVIGVAGLLFHPVFDAYVQVSQNHMLPMMEAPQVARAYQWASASALILPQCILLGATFPLLSAGFLRIAPANDGRVLGGLYFSNSIGAAVGALFATFLLLPRVGMPGAMVTAGAVNIAVAVGAFVLWAWLRRFDAIGTPTAATAEHVPVAKVEPPVPAGESVRLAPILLAATFLSGAFSFMYEIGWIRLLNQALGTTVHSFELMLSAFIAGLAFGGLWVRQRGSRIVSAVRYAGYAQVLMGLAALVSVVVLTQSFAWVGWLMAVLPPTEEGYRNFMLGSAVIAMAVMFPAAFFAGMTLPLFTMALLRRGEGEKSIGRIYAANTLGAIVGVLVMVHVVMPLVGIRWGVTLAATGDALLGLVLLYFVAGKPPVRRHAPLLAATAAVLLFSVLFGAPDPLKQASGVFRSGNVVLDGTDEVAFLRDGKTSTIAAYATRDGRYGSIATNGKPDASMSMSLDDAPVSDEVTMLMLGALPLAIHPQPSQVALVGWGSGLSTHTVLGSPVPRRVDTIEIERAMVEGARFFGDRVARAYEDPRSQLVVDDARTYLATSRQGFDVIISQPSNPWVSGVASLFTEEFYALTRNRLNEGGLFVQWLQAYEIDQALLTTMVTALTRHYPYVDLYLTNTADLLFVASMSPLQPADWSRLEHPELLGELQRVGLRGVEDLYVRRIGGERVMEAVGKLYGSPSHSDYHPIVSLRAPRARFMRQSAVAFVDIAMSGLPILAMTEGAEPVDPLHVTPDEDSFLAMNAYRAVHARRKLLGQAYEPYEGQEPVSHLLEMSRDVVPDARTAEWSQVASEAFEQVLADFDAEALAGVVVDPQWIALEEQGAVVDQVMDAYAATARRSPEEMYRSGQAVLELPEGSVSDLTREHALIIAQLGAIGLGRPDEVFAMNRGIGARVPVSARHGYARSFLLAWADGMPRSRVEDE